MTISVDQVADAGDAFMTKLVDWAGNYHREQHDALRPDLGSLLASMRLVATGDRVDLFAEAVRGLMAEHDQWVSDPIASGGVNSFAAMPPERLAAAWAALDDALVDFDDTQIDAARVELGGAERAVLDAQRRVEDALADEDFDAVWAARKEAQIEAPERVDRARVELARLQAARARAALARPHARAALLRARVEAAQAALDDAERAVPVALAAVRECAKLRSLIGQLASAPAIQAQRAADQYETERQVAAGARQARVRVLALP